VSILEYVLTSWDCELTAGWQTLNCCCSCKSEPLLVTPRGVTGWWPDRLRQGPCNLHVSARVVPCNRTVQH